MTREDRITSITSMMGKDRREQDQSYFFRDDINNLFFGTDLAVGTDALKMTRWIADRNSTKKTGEKHERN